MLVRIDCRLCVAAKTKGKYGIENTVLFESDHFIVIPTIGQFVEGWLMVVSKQHVLCAREHPYGELCELTDVLDYVSIILREIYGEVAIFEHGPSRHRDIMAGCCVDHTHVHIVPCKDLDVLSTSLPFNLKSKINISELGYFRDDHNGYIILQDRLDNNRYSLYDVNAQIPNQYMRRLIGYIHGHSKTWDWRLYPFRENIERTVKVIFERSSWEQLV